MLKSSIRRFRCFIKAPVNYGVYKNNFICRVFESNMDMSKEVGNEKSIEPTSVLSSDKKLATFGTVWDRIRDRGFISVEHPIPSNKQKV
jgi:hypothetical protein